MAFHRYIFFFLFLFLVVSCQKKSDELLVKKTFFDLISFVEKESKDLKDKECSIYKEGEINQNSDQTSLPSNEIHWDKELEILANMDINKSSWIDHFIVDTTKYENQQLGKIIQIHYHTKSTKIPVKDLVIIFQEEDLTRPVWIEARREVKNWIFHTQQKVFYNTGSGLRAEGYQKILWLKEKTFNITTIYNCKHESN
ncbi:MAG: hypothetical protein LC105_09125 [Chitinophagales bacterium]|nr:hypothetical protein [Chitinophagales bacterium]